MRTFHLKRKLKEQEDKVKKKKAVEKVFEKKAVSASSGPCKKKKTTALSLGYKRRRRRTGRGACTKAEPTPDFFHTKAAV